MFLRKASVDVEEIYEHHNEDTQEFDYQFRHVVLGTELITPDEESTDCPSYFRTLLHLGVRWGEEQQESDEDDDDNFVVLGKIEATFVAEYELTDVGMSSECLREFSLRAPSFHVWPYWREFVANTAARCNVPKIVMPPMQAAQNAVEDIADLEVRETEKAIFRSRKSSLESPERPEAVEKSRAEVGSSKDLAKKSKAGTKSAKGSAKGKGATKVRAKT